MLNLIDLLRVPEVDTGLQFDISPDGRTIAFSWNKSGKWEIYTSPMQGDCFAPLAMTFNEGGAKFSPRFSPNGKRLAYALDPDGSESYHIILLDLETGIHTDLTPSSAYAHQPNFSFSPDGNSLAVLSDEPGQFALFLLSLLTAEKKLLLDLHRPIWDVRWSPDGRWIVAEAEMEASDRGIFVVDAGSGRSERIESDGKGLNARQPAWSPDSGSLAFSAESGEWFDIGLCEMGTGAVTWLTQGHGDDTSPAWSQDGKRVCWLHAGGAANNICVREKEVTHYRAGLGVHHSPRFTRDGEIVFLFESPQQPPDLWKLDPAGRFEQLTFSLPNELQSGLFVFPEEVSYEGDGVSVPALLYRGRGDRAVIDIHGGPNWHVQFLWDPFAAHMASRGWTVLLPNYRGSTGYGRAWQIASRFDLGGVDTQDCMAGVDYLKGEGLGGRCAVTGRSHGGYLTMTCLTRSPERWCGGSAVVPFMNWFKSHENSRQDLQHWNIENMGDPQANYERWYNASPYFFLDRIRAPIQLICGAHDPRCPAGESLDARDKLIGLGRQVELFLYEEEGHSFLNIDNVVDAELKRVTFLAKVLKE